MREVIIDTDPGADDALALMMALNSDALSVRGITTVGGNATLSETTRNALRLVEYYEREMGAGAGKDAPPIVSGAECPTHGRFTHAYHVHGPGRSGRGSAGAGFEAARDGRARLHPSSGIAVAR